MNAAIGLHVAYHDAEPVVFLIGQAERDELNRLALQEMNYAKTFSDTAKAVIECVHNDNIAEDTARAFHIAQSGTPGPVALILPEDLLYGDCEAEAAQPRAAARSRAVARPATPVSTRDGKAARAGRRHPTARSAALAVARPITR